MNNDGLIARPILRYEAASSGNAVPGARSSTREFRWTGTAVVLSFLMSLVGTVHAQLLVPKEVPSPAPANVPEPRSLDGGTQVKPPQDSSGGKRTSGRLGSPNEKVTPNASKERLPEVLAIVGDEKITSKEFERKLSFSVRMMADNTSTA